VKLPESKGVRAATSPRLTSEGLANRIWQQAESGRGELKPYGLLSGEFDPIATPKISKTKREEE
jgi:hypothetical protein